ncbi:interleukin-21 [Dendropsophus ebraccatus]|uniref:interleukin-21 n=1 Tax=Dendropsophus ebraccatus TaxID=150705 RepID=UPI003831DA71
MCFLAAAAFLHAAVSIDKCLEIQKVAKNIIRFANKTHPHAFHVPTNVTEECQESALICFRSQLPKLHVANGNNKALLDTCVRKIKLSRAHYHGMCTPCSNYSTKSPREFLNKMEQLLQKIVVSKS